MYPDLTRHSLLDSEGSVNPTSEGNPEVESDPIEQAVDTIVNIYNASTTEEKAKIIGMLEKGLCLSLRGSPTQQLEGATEQTEEVQGENISSSQAVEIKGDEEESMDPKGKLKNLVQEHFDNGSPEITDILDRTTRQPLDGKKEHMQRVLDILKLLYTFPNLVPDSIKEEFRTQSTLNQLQYIPTYELDNLGVYEIYNQNDINAAMNLACNPIVSGIPRTFEDLEVTTNEVLSDVGSLFKLLKAENIQSIRDLYKQQMDIIFGNEQQGQEAILDQIGSRLAYIRIPSRYTIPRDIGEKSDINPYGYTRDTSFENLQRLQVLGESLVSFLKDADKAMKVNEILQNAQSVKRISLFNRRSNESREAQARRILDDDGIRLEVSQRVLLGNYLRDTAEIDELIDKDYDQSSIATLQADVQVLQNSITTLSQVKQNWEQSQITVNCELPFRFSGIRNRLEQTHNDNNIVEMKFAREVMGSLDDIGQSEKSVQAIFSDNVMASCQSLLKALPDTEGAWRKILQDSKPEERKEFLRWLIVGVYSSDNERIIALIRNRYNIDTQFNVSGKKQLNYIALGYILGRKVSLGSVDAVPNIAADQIDQGYGVNTLNSVATMFFEGIQKRDPDIITNIAQKLNPAALNQIA